MAHLKQSSRIHLLRNGGGWEVCSFCARLNGQHVDSVSSEGACRCSRRHHVLYRKQMTIACI